MDKEKPSLADVEQMLAELAPTALPEGGRRARMERARESACRAARAEINRVFFRRRCLRAAGYVAALGLLACPLAWLVQESGVPSAPTPLAMASPASVSPAPAPVPAPDAAGLIGDAFAALAEGAEDLLTDLFESTVSPLAHSALPSHKDSEPVALPVVVPSEPSTEPGSLAGTNSCVTPGQKAHEEDAEEEEDAFTDVAMSEAAPLARSESRPRHGKKAHRKAKATASFGSDARLELDPQGRLSVSCLGGYDIRPLRAPAPDARLSRARASASDAAVRREVASRALVSEVDFGFDARPLTPEEWEACRESVRLREGGAPEAPRGLLVSNVAPGGPAAKAGLKVGDLVLELDGSALACPEDLLMGTLASRAGQPGHFLTLRGQGWRALLISPAKRARPRTVGHVLPLVLHAERAAELREPQLGLARQLVGEGAPDLAALRRDMRAFQQQLCQAYRPGTLQLEFSHGGTRATIQGEGDGIVVTLESQGQAHCCVLLEQGDALPPVMLRPLADLLDAVERAL